MGAEADERPEDESGEILRLRSGWLRQLWVYERIIRRYTRYVLIRCTAYTNEKA